MRMLYENVYCLFSERINLRVKCQYILLEFMYLLIKFILQFAEELSRNGWEKDEIYCLIDRESFKKVKSDQFEIEELLLLVNIKIKDDVFLNKR